MIWVGGEKKKRREYICICGEDSLKFHWQPRLKLTSPKALLHLLSWPQFLFGEGFGSLFERAPKQLKRECFAWMTVLSADPVTSDFDFVRLPESHTVVCQQMRGCCAARSFTRQSKCPGRHVRLPCELFKRGVRRDWWPTVNVTGMLSSHVSPPATHAHSVFIHLFFFCPTKWCWLFRPRASLIDFACSLKKKKKSSVSPSFLHAAQLLMTCLFGFDLIYLCCSVLLFHWTTTTTKKTHTFLISWGILWGAFLHFICTEINLSKWETGYLLICLASVLLPLISYPVILK